MNGFTFTIYYWGSGSNYYHMHYDVLIPLYQALYYKKQPQDVVMMPVVESSRLQVGWPNLARCKLPTLEYIC